VQVICNGEEVMSLGGTQAEYNVDIWSGNHPFYQVRGRSQELQYLVGRYVSAAQEGSTRTQRAVFRLVWCERKGATGMVVEVRVRAAASSAAADGSVQQHMTGAAAH
jgi:hypothetical protein